MLTLDHAQPTENESRPSVDEIDMAIRERAEHEVDVCVMRFNDWLADDHELIMLVVRAAIFADAHQTETAKGDLSRIIERLREAYVAERIECATDSERDDIERALEE